MKRALVTAIIVGLLVVPLFAQGSKETTVKTDTSKQVYQDGSVLIWSTGQPQFRKMYYQGWIERNRDIAPGVNVEVESIATMSEGQQKLAMYSLSGDTESMPEVIMLDAVGIVDLVSAGLLQDVTSYYNSVSAEFVDGAASDATINGKVYGLPDAVRPQMLFYNAAVFEKYDVDPAMMATFEGYYEAGKLLKERSNGEVYLSYVDPANYTWRYWGRRGLMPQANARLWDENGNIVIGQDAGAKLALEYFAKLNESGLLYKTRMFQQPLYEATDDGKIATFYIGAFWDEFLRKNLTATAGDWKAMSAPVFESVGTAGAPVSTSFCLVDTGTNEYTELFQQLWYDFQTNTAERNAWVMEMDKIKGPYSNPVSKKILADPFWQSPSEFYGGQSFKKAEGDGLANSSKNMTVTASDAEADTIISAEIEKYVAGEQTMAQAIANMDKELKIRIKKVMIP
jgi:multiple sugar transport system substrate-binding protein